MEKLYLLGNMHYQQDFVIAIDAEAKYSFTYFFPRIFKKGRLRDGVGVHISLVIRCHLLTCTWSREAGQVETHSPSIRLFTFKGKVHIVSISYQRIKHVWCERICDLDIQGAYLQRERYGFFFIQGQLTSISCPKIKCKDEVLLCLFQINLQSQPN